MKKMRLRKPVLVAAAAAATTAAVCGVLLTTHAAFTTRTAAGALTVSAGRLNVELTTSQAGQEPIRVDLSDVGPDLMWPPENALTVSLRNTGTLDGVISALETVEVADDGPAGSAALSRALEVAVSTDPAQNWHDPALTWERIAEDTGLPPVVSSLRSWGAFQLARLAPSTSNCVLWARTTWRPMRERPPLSA